MARVPAFITGLCCDRLNRALDPSQNPNVSFTVFTRNWGKCIFGKKNKIKKNKIIVCSDQRSLGLKLSVHCPGFQRTGTDSPLTRFLKMSIRHWRHLHIEKKKKTGVFPQSGTLSEADFDAFFFQMTICLTLIAILRVGSFPRGDKCKRLF